MDVERESSLAQRFDWGRVAARPDRSAHDVPDMLVVVEEGQLDLHYIECLFPVVFKHS